jgi:hypothetical protein
MEFISQLKGLATRPLKKPNKPSDQGKNAQ